MLYTPTYDHAKTPLTYISFFQAVWMAPDSHHHDCGADLSMFHPLLLPGQLSSAEVLENVLKNRTSSLWHQSKRACNQASRKKYRLLFWSHWPSTISYSQQRRLAEDFVLAYLWSTKAVLQHVTQVCEQQKRQIQERRSGSHCFSNCGGSPGMFYWNKSFAMFSVF